MTRRPKTTTSGLHGFSTITDIDAAIEAIDKRIAQGEISPEAGQTAKRMLQVRRQKMTGSDTMPEEGPVKVTDGCIISRVGGLLYVRFPQGASPSVEETMRGQGFQEKSGSWTAPFTTERYLFALDLCAGFEQTAAGLDEDAVRNVIAKYMTGHKVSMDNLGDDVKKALAEKVKKVVVEAMPDAPAQEAASASYVPDYWRILDDVLLGHNVFLVGPAGSGKTFLAEEIARTLGREYITINCSQYTSPTDIKGGPTIDGYTEGALIEAWRDGKILILDELPKIDPNTAGLLNEALAKTKLKADNSRSVIYNGRNQAIQKSEGFGCIATGNIYPNAESAAYAANTKQDLSLLDRFTGSVYFIGFNSKLEKSVASYTLLYAVAEKIRQFFLENRVEATISLRFMETARDVLTLEMERLNNADRKDKDRLDTGKTLKSHVDGVISTLTEVQQEYLKQYIDYGRILASYQYRSMDMGKSPYGK